MWQISWNSNEWLLRNWHVSEKAKYMYMYSAFNHNFFIWCTCTAFNWGLLVTKKKLRITRFFGLLPFLTYLCNKRLKPSIHCIQLWRKIAQIVWALSKKNVHLYWQNVCFYAKLHYKSALENCVRPHLRLFSNKKTVANENNSAVGSISFMRSVLL